MRPWTAWWRRGRAGRIIAFRPGWRTFALAWGVATAGLLAGMIALSPAIPDVTAVRDRYAASEAVLLDRDGVVIQETRVDPTRRRLPWTSLAAVSRHFLEAVIAVEDHRFREHPGVDMVATLANAERYARGDDARGTSTLSMQTFDLITGGRARASRWAKVRQALGALALERHWTKDQVLEAYVNLVSYRGELQGIGAAARALFRKEAHGLDAEESWILAALLRSPRANPEAVAERACRLSRALSRPVDCARLRALAASRLPGPHVLAGGAALAPELARALPRGAQAARVHRSTLDRRLQAFARQSVEDQLASLADENVHEAAVLVLDNATGDVLAYVGNPGPRFSAFPYVDGVRAKRQAGSTLKPFLYAAALERRLITSETLLDDAPLLIPVGGHLYRPRNYDQSFHGPVPARVALASSLNVPAVRVLQFVGVDAFVSYLGEFGVPVPHEPDYYGPALALGSLEVSLWDLTNAYRALARGGQASPARWLVADPAHVPPVAARRVADPGAAFIVQRILSDRDSRALTFGLENVLATRFWSAVKTGTSKDMRDNWCVGFSSRYTVGVWVGNFNGEPMRSVTGITGAGPLWLALMNRLHAATPSEAPTPPPGVVARVLRAGARQHDAWFLAGTEIAAAEEPVPMAGKSRIRYPVAGMILAHDPDIPPSRQRLFLEADPSPRRLTWVLDDAPLPAGTQSVPLTDLAPGKHEIRLDEEGLGTVDRVPFSMAPGPDPAKATH